jgi:hypothetical protein
VEAIRALVVAKRSSRSTKIKTLNQIRHLSFTAPDELRGRLKGLSREHLAVEAAALRPRTGGDPVIFATKTALPSSDTECWPSMSKETASTPFSPSSSRRPRPSYTECPADDRHRDVGLLRLDEGEAHFGE